MTQAFNLALLANKVNSSGQLDASTGLYNLPIPSGSVFLLYQASAPTGWTQVTTLNDYSLRIVSTAGGGTGGTTAFSTVFANQTVSTTVSFSGSVGATTLSTAQMPSHTHDVYNPTPGCYFAAPSKAYGAWDGGSLPTTAGVFATGGGGSHTHSFSGSGSGTSSAVTLNVRYANMILCSKN